MQKSQIISLSWSFRTHRDDNYEDENAWPELGHRNQMRPVNKKNPCIERPIKAEDTDVKVSLDNSEYPALGDATVKTKSTAPPNKFCYLPCTSDESVSAIINQEPRKLKHGKRYRKTDKIYINLQEALQNTRYIKKIHGKVTTRVKVNICKPNSCTSISSYDAGRGKSAEIRKIKISISKAKKPTKLKKIILLDRDIKAYYSSRRAAFEYEKMEAICKDVNAINFSALKITADPEIDVDYVKRLSALTFYGKDYRNKNGANYLEATLDHSSDILEKLNNLHIRGNSAQNYLSRHGSINTSRNCENVVENDLLHRTLLLELNEDDKEETKDSTLLDNKVSVRHSRNFREYCTNTLTPELNKSLEKFLHEITRLQRKHYERDQNRAKYKRRYYSGLKEVRKHVELNKVKFVVIAPDVEKVVLEGGLDDEVYSLLGTCKKRNVVFCFGLRRRKLGYYTHGKGLVGCVGIANYSGTEEIFKNVLIEVVRARNTFKQLNGETDAIIDISKLSLDDYFLSEVINILMKTLSPFGAQNDK